MYEVWRYCTSTYGSRLYSYELAMKHLLTQRILHSATLMLFQSSPRTYPSASWHLEVL